MDFSVWQNMYLTGNSEYTTGTVTSVGVQPLSAGVSESVNSSCSRQVWWHRLEAVYRIECECVTPASSVEQLDLERPSVAFAGASKLSPFRADEVFGTSVFFQTVLHGAWQFPFWNQVSFFFFFFFKKSGFSSCFQKETVVWKLLSENSHWRPALFQTLAQFSALWLTCQWGRGFGPDCWSPLPLDPSRVRLRGEQRVERAGGAGLLAREPSWPGGCSAAGSDVTFPRLACPCLPSCMSPLHLTQSSNRTVLLFPILIFSF